MTDTVWIKLIEGVPLTIGAVSTALLAFNTWRNGKKTEIAIEQNDRIEEKTDQIHEKATTAIQQNEKIAVQTDGRFSELILTIQGLTSEVTAERSLREQREKELAYSLAVLSARFGKPIATIRAMVRAEDFGEMPGQWLGDDPPPKRRRADKIKRTNGDRLEDKG